MKLHVCRNHNPIALVLVLVIVCLVTAGCAESPSYHRLQGQTMGTTWSAKYKGADPEAMQEEIDATLVRINAQMSTYDPLSELSLVNNAPVNEAVQVSPEVVEVLRIARQIHAASGGAFDVTIGPLVNLWGFGPDPSQNVVPADEAIAQAMTRIGEESLMIADGAVARSKPVYVDLSSIAKGFAVDQVAELLLSRGVKNYLVEIGGELKAGGVNERGQTWRIAIEKPDSQSRSIQTTMVLHNLAMATSGDYRNYFEKDGVRYSHMIDPRTGRPITHGVASVTVLHEQSALADGYATALSVMGEKEGMAMAEAHQLRVLIIINRDGEFVERNSSAMDTYLQSHSGS